MVNSIQKVNVKHTVFLSSKDELQANKKVNIHQPYKGNKYYAKITQKQDA